MKCTELVMQDHIILRQGLDILDGMVTTMESGGRIEIADVIAILKFFRFGLEYQQTAEEQILSPAVLGASHSQLLAEHAQHTTQLAEVEFALESRRGSEFVRCSRWFGFCMRNHLDKEDLMLRRIGDEQLSIEDTEFAEEVTKRRKHAEAAANLSRLQAKYAKKPLGHQPGYAGAVKRSAATAL
jgi:hemerythrin-like domain-containing protein